MDVGTFNELVQYLLNGIVSGSLLALAAIGLTLVYGILNLGNFAHGDYVTVGAYAALFVNVTLLASDATLYAAAFAVLLAGAVLLDRLASRRLSRGEATLLLAVAGALLVLAAGQYLYGGSAPTEAEAFPVLGPAVGFLLSEFTLAIVAGVLTASALAVALDLVLWRPLRRKGATVLTLMIVSIGLALALRHLIVMVPAFETRIHNFDRPVLGPLEFGPWWVGGEQVGPFLLTKDKLLVTAVAGLVILGVHLLLRYTRMGKALRALADNRDLARVTGIDVDRMILAMWALAGGLAGLAGVLLATITNIHSNLGWHILLPVFAAVVLGGIGSPYGALAGAFTISIAMELTSLLDLTEYRAAVAFLALIVVLLVRPRGIFGVTS